MSIKHSIQKYPVCSVNIMEKTMSNNAGKFADGMQGSNANPAAKLKLIADFSEEFRYSGSSAALHASKAGFTKQHRLLHLCTVLDQARACEQQDQCQSLCADIRTHLVSSLEEKIVCRLAEVLSSVCPLLASTIAATRQAASIVIRTLAAKVRVEVLVQHTECLASHMCSAVMCCGDASLDTMELLLVSAPHLVLHCTQQLMPHILALLFHENRPRQFALKNLRSLCNKSSKPDALSIDEKQICMKWMTELKNTYENNSCAPKLTLQLHTSLLSFFSGLVQLSLHLRADLLDADCNSSAGVSKMLLQVIAVVAGCGRTEALLHCCSLDDEAVLHLVGNQLMLLEMLHCALSDRVTKEWLAVAMESSLAKLHHILLPPLPASTRPSAATGHLLELRLSFLVLACQSHHYKPCNLNLLAQALCGTISVLAVNTFHTPALRYSNIY